MTSVFLNGRLVPENEAVVSVFDRSFLYGDGLFETLRICNGKPFRWAEHYARLQQGAGFLKLRVPFSEPELRAQALRLVEVNQPSDALLRITLSRGAGIRGYSLQGADRPVVVMSIHPAAPWHPARPAQWRLVTSTYRVPQGDRLAQFKTCNKLGNILARAEAEAAGADEALLLNTAGEIAEAAGSNIFWIRNGAVQTPPLEVGLLPGITRAVVMELCAELRVPAAEAILPANANAYAGLETIFLSLSSFGIVQVTGIDGHNFRPHPLVSRLYSAYHRLVQQETAPG